MPRSRRSRHSLRMTIKAGPIGYVLTGWDPLRLALEIAWLDQITKGRTIIGFARGYQARWLNQMAQHLHVGAAAMNTKESQPTNDAVNREAFQEIFEIIKLAWKEGSIPTVLTSDPAILRKFAEVHVEDWQRKRRAQGDGSSGNPIRATCRWMT